MMGGRLLSKQIECEIAFTFHFKSLTVKETLFPLRVIYQKLKNCFGEKI